MSDLYHFQDRAFVRGPRRVSRLPRACIVAFGPRQHKCVFMYQDQAQANRSERSAMSKTSARLVRAGSEVETDASGLNATLKYYVWISAKEAEAKGFVASRFDLWTIAERSPCGTAFYNTVLDKLRALDETKYPLTSDEREKTAVRRRNMAKGFSDWLGRWAIEQTVTMVDGQPGLERETVIIARDTEVMASLVKYRRRSSAAAQSVSRRTSSSASSTAPIGAQHTMPSASKVRRASIGRLPVPVTVRS